MIYPLLIGFESGKVHFLQMLEQWTLNMDLLKVGIISDIFVFVL